MSMSNPLDLDVYCPDCRAERQLRLRAYGEPCTECGSTAPARLRNDSPREQTGFTAQVRFDLDQHGDGLRLSDAACKRALADALADDPDVLRLDLGPYAFRPPLEVVAAFRERPWCQVEVIARHGRTARAWLRAIKWQQQETLNYLSGRARTPLQAPPSESDGRA